MKFTNQPMQSSVDIPDQILEALEALDHEIKTVQERPSQDRLFQGKRQKKTTSEKGTDYLFETKNMSIQHAEEVKATVEEKVYSAKPVSYEKQQLLLRFPENLGKEIKETDLEWENDFILQRNRERLERILETPDLHTRVEMLFESGAMLAPSTRETEKGQQIEKRSAERGDKGGDREVGDREVGDREVSDREVGDREVGGREVGDREGGDKGGDREKVMDANGRRVYHDGRRNPAQLDAIRKAMTARALFIWGPPGTGKTATLGYIIANYLLRGKKVLFASNTNRAVDVGLLSVRDALLALRAKMDEERISRFGDAALDDPGLIPFLFDKQMELVMERQRARAGEGVDLLVKRNQLMKKVEERLLAGKKIPGKLEAELTLVDQRVRDLGGQEVLQEQLDQAGRVNERGQLRKRKLVATTLAKVCTSELFHDLSFDAVVVDEGSMANLPYLMVMASHARHHMVVVGDPMQLPPIAVTDHADSRDFLEREIFTHVSGASSTSELFEWHDRNPGFTSFFDTQYRLDGSLADVISTVFYEGRLRTAGDTDISDQSADAYHLVDTSRYQPVLTKRSDYKGFLPVNEVHQTILIKLIEKLLAKGVSAGQIGVIVPFRGVVYDLRDRLWKEGFRSVEVGTIHTYQGREKDYILFDTVMSGELTSSGQKRHYSVRPLDEQKKGMSVPRLLNVAFSRSKKELVVIADMEHVKRVYGNKFLGKLLERIR